MTRIIVVDDDRDICDLVQYRLTVMGMEVDAYFDGESGLKAIVADPPDLAIIDVMMPKLNGLEVVRAIRADEAIRDLPVIIFTAMGEPEDWEAGGEAGADYYAVKPFSMLALGAYVQKILGLVTCIVCGKKRGVGDADYAPEQELHRAAVGWTVTVDGEICGDCRETALTQRT